MTRDRIKDQITEWLQAGERDIKGLLADCYAMSDAEAKTLWIGYIDDKYG